MPISILPIISSNQSSYPIETKKDALCEIFMASEEMSLENVDDGRTDDECLTILWAHLWAFGSGELKRV